MENQFDVAVLGGGSGGYVAAIRASQLGLKVVLVEKDKIGGTCLHRGCIPTKSFLETAGFLARTRRAGDFGVLVENPALDYPRLRKRTDQIVGQLTRGVEFLLQKNGVTLIRGEGVFRSPSTIAVPGADRERVVSAGNVVIATGSSPKAVPGMTFDGKRVISSDHALYLEEPPKSVVIVGAGAIGMEFASVYNDFGADVTVVEMLPSLMPLEDREVSAEIAKSFSRRGIKSFVNARAENVRVDDSGVTLDVAHDGKVDSLRAEVLLVAVGRAASLTGYGLETLGIATEKGFIKVDKLQRTNVAGVYAVGDVAGGYLLAHKAMKEGEVAVETIAGREAVPIDPDRIPRATYCRPEVASVGLSEDAARGQNRKIKVGHFPFRANGRALITGEADGFAKMISDEQSGEILGVHLIGPHVTELIAEPTLAKLLEATPWEEGISIHPHPTLSEVIGEVALDTEGHPIHIFKGPPAAERTA